MAKSSEPQWVHKLCDFCSHKKLTFYFYENRNRPLFHHLLHKIYIHLWHIYNRMQYSYTFELFLESDTELLSSRKAAGSIFHKSDASNVDFLPWMLLLRSVGFDIQCIFFMKNAVNFRLFTNFGTLSVFFVPFYLNVILIFLFVHSFVCLSALMNHDFKSAHQF